MNIHLRASLEASLNRDMIWRGLQSSIDVVSDALEAGLDDETYGQLVIEAARLNNLLTHYAMDTEAA